MPFCTTTGRRRRRRRCKEQATTVRPTRTHENGAEPRHTMPRHATLSLSPLTNKVNKQYLAACTAVTDSTGHRAMPQHNGACNDRGGRRVPSTTVAFLYRWHANRGFVTRKSPRGPKQTVRDQR